MVGRQGFGGSAMGPLSVRDGSAEGLRWFRGGPSVGLPWVCSGSAVGLRWVSGGDVRHGLLDNDGISIFPKMC